MTTVLAQKIRGNHVVKRNVGENETNNVSKRIETNLGTTMKRQPI
jgi:hypothetical protein